MNKILFLSMFPLALSAFASAALSDGVSGTGTTESAIPLDYKTLVVDGGMSYYPGADLGLKKDGKTVDVGYSSRFDGIGAISYGLLPFLEGSFLYPYYWDVDPSGKEIKGLGDVRTSLKLNYPPYPHKKGFEVSLLAQVDWPTATDAAIYGGYTRHAWYSESTKFGDTTRNSFGANGPTLITRMLTTANFGAIDGMFPLLVHLNWGAAFTGASSQNAFILGGGIEASPYTALTIFWSFNSEIPISQASKNIPLLDYPLASSVGLQIAFPKSPISMYGGVHFVINNFADTLYAPPANASVDAASSGRFPTFGWFGGVQTKFNLAPKEKEVDSRKLVSKDAPKADGTKAEPTKAEPIKADATKPESTTGEPAKVEPAKAEPVKAVTKPAP